VHIVSDRGKISGFPCLGVETDFYNISKFTGQNDCNYLKVVVVLLKLLRTRTSQLFHAVGEAAKGTHENYQKLKRLLDTGVSVDMLSVNDRKALHEVAKTGPWDVTSLLIGKGGTSINYQDGKGMTALHYAVQESLPKVVEFLLSKGADMNILNKDSISAIGIAKRKKLKNDKEKSKSKEKSGNSWKDGKNAKDGKGGKGGENEKAGNNGKNEIKKKLEIKRKLEKLENDEKIYEMLCNPPPHFDHLLKDR